MREIYELSDTDSLSDGLCGGDKAIGHLAVREHLPRGHSEGRNVSLLGQPTLLESLGRHPPDGHVLVLRTVRVRLVVAVHGEAEVGDLDARGRGVACVKGEDEDVASR